MNIILPLAFLPLIASHGDPNADLVFANSGVQLGVDNGLNRRILTNEPNYDNVFGKDSELEKLAQDMKHNLSHFRDASNPTVEEWINIKNLAASAVRGDCHSADKLYEAHVIPRIDYDNLLERCGRGSEERRIAGHLQMMRAQEKAGSEMAHANLNHLREHGIDHNLSHANGDHDEHYLDLGNDMHTGEALSHGIHHNHPGGSVNDSIYNDADTRREAMEYLGRNHDGLKNTLEHINTPFAREAIDRINKTKKIAEDVIQGISGAAEAFHDVQGGNEVFKEHTLGHGSIDEDIRRALTATNEAEHVNSIHLDPHEIAYDVHGHGHLEADHHAAAEEVKHEMAHEAEHQLEHEVDRHMAEQAQHEAQHEMAHEIDHQIDHEMLDHSHDGASNFARDIFNGYIHDGNSEGEAGVASKAAGMAAAEYEKNRHAGMTSRASIDKALHDTWQHMNHKVPDRVATALERYADGYGENLHGHPIHQAIEIAKEDIANKGHALEEAAQELDVRKHIAERKIIEAEQKARYAEDKIKEANLTERQKKVLDWISKEKSKMTVDQRKEADMLLEKKMRYESGIRRDQAKKVGQPTNMTELSEIKKEFESNKERNKRIVEDEKRAREDAAHHRAEGYAMHSIPQKPVEVINSESMLSSEKKDSRVAEELLAKQAEEKEIREAGSIAAQNVKRLGGSDEQAAAEAERAQKVKRKMIENSKMEQATKYKEKLEHQVGRQKAIKEAEHIAAAHSGRNPTGNTLWDIEEKMKTVGEEEEKKKWKQNTTLDEQLCVIKILPDDVEEITVDNSVIELPLTGIPSEKAKTEEEEKIKEDLVNLRDNLRNKVTQKKIPSGLVTIKGFEGYMNLPESCKEILISRGVVYFDQAGYDHMVGQKLDVAALRPVYSRGNEPLYYTSEIKNMKMHFPSVLNTNPQKLVFNEYESINIEYAKKIEVQNGVVDCEAWSDFSSRIRPKVYKGVSKGANEVPDFIKKEFERIEHMKDGMKDAKVSVLKNPDGSIVAEIKPQYGVSTKLPFGDAVNMAAELGKTRPLMRIPDDYLNVGNEEGKDYTNEFMKNVERDIIKKEGRPEILNDKNSLNGKTSETIRRLKKTPPPAEMNKKYNRAGNDAGTMAFNYIVNSSVKESNCIGMKQEDFLESISRIDQKTIFELLKSYFEVSMSVDFQKKIAELDKGGFFNKIREHFPNKNVSDVVRLFFRAFAVILKGPNNIEMTPVTKLVSYGEKCPKKCYNTKLKQCMMNCVVTGGTAVRINPYKIVPLVPPTRIRSADKIIITQPQSLESYMGKFQQIPKPLEICQPNQKTGCILQGSGLAMNYKSNTMPSIGWRIPNNLSVNGPQKHTKN